MRKCHNDAIYEIGEISSLQFSYITILTLFEI